MKKAEDHAKFLAEFAAELGYFFEICSSDIDRTTEFLEWFGGKVFEHGYKHGKEDASKCCQDAKSGRGCVLMDKEGERVTERWGMEEK